MGKTAVCGLILLIAGCGRGEASRVPVKGQVYYRGQLLNQGVVVFTPDADRGGAANEQGTASIQADGGYEIRTDKGAGLPPGWYKISIAATNQPAFPDKYRNPERSGLAREVVAGKDNVIDFRLEE
jgi:hypothetical protein